MVHLFLAPVALAVLAAPPPWEARFFQAPPAEVLDAARQVPVPPRTGADVLWRDVRFTFDARGRRTTVSRLVYRLHTRQAVEDWGKLEAYHSPWYEEKPAIRVRVITADGVAHRLDKKTLSESSAGKDEKAPLEFREERITRGPLPAVAPGCVVEEELTMRERRPLFDGGTVHDVRVIHAAPTQGTRITVTAPAALPLQYRMLGTDQTMTDRRAGAQRELSLVIGPQPRAPRTLTLLPPDVPRAPTLAFATGKDWQAVARGYQALVQGRITPAAVAKVARTLAGTSRDPAVLVPRFMAHVRHNVRYAAVEFGDASIIPRAPAEVFKRGYGDCKDLSTLLVSMLRAVDVPAHLALLRAGPGADVHPDLPGLGMFNHAIVWVPGGTPQWVDPTELYGSPLELPYGDQDRLALVVDGATTALVRTPRLPHTVHTYAETREVNIQVDGPAQIVESTRATGSLGAFVRASYADHAADQREETLKRYVKDVYRGELAGVEFGNLEEPDLPLELRVRATKARAVWTDDREATVMLTAYPAVDHLPRELIPRDGDDGADEDDEGADKPPPRTADHVLNLGFVGSVAYVVRAPEGMTLEKLPEPWEKAVAGARFGRTVARDADGAARVTMTLDTGNGRYSPAQFTDLKAAVGEFLKVSRVPLTWRHTSRWLVAQGRGREGYQEHARMIARYPGQAVYRERLAKDLLAQGFGLAARAEAARAVEVEPQRAEAHFTRAWILMHDELARYVRPGFDRPGAVDALRRGLEHTKDDVWARAALAEMLTYDDRARRYRPELDPTESIALFESIRTELKDHSRDLRFMALLARTGRFAQLEQVAQDAAPGPERNGYLATAVAAQRGPEAVDGALRRTVKSQPERSAALVQAADEHVRLAQYPLAAALLRLAAEQSEAPAQLLTRARFLGQVKPWMWPTTPVTDPGELVLRYALGFMSPEATDAELAPLLARAPECALQPEDRRFVDDVARAQGGLPPTVLRDITALAITTAAEGDPSTGWRVRLVSKVPNVQQGQETYVVVEDGALRVLNLPQGSLACLGAQALKALEAGQPRAARQWLDWARQSVVVPAGDDPLRGPPFAALWTEGQAATPEAMRVAAAALLANGPRASAAAPVLAAALRGHLAPPQQTAVRLALLVAAKDDKTWDVNTQALLQQHPGSHLAQDMRLTALLEARRFAEAEAQWQARTKASPKDPYLMAQVARLAQAQGQYARAEQVYARMEAMGSAGNFVLNNAAWLALFSGSSLDDAINRAQHAAGDKGDARAELNTLAALYADAGRVRESLEILRKLYPPESQNAPEPSDLAVWGRLAEQQGLNDVARTLYQRVGTGEKAHPIGVETWVARRLASMSPPPGK